MRSVGWVPNPIGMTGILLRGHKDTDTEGEGQVKTASETGERQLQAKDCQVLLTALRNREEARRRSPLQDSEGAQPRQHLDFELLAVRTVGQYISEVSSHPVWGTSLTATLGNECSHEVEMSLVCCRNMEASVAGVGVTEVIEGQRGYLTGGEVTALYGQRSHVILFFRGFTYTVFMAQRKCVEEPGLYQVEEIILMIKSFICSLGLFSSIVPMHS